MKLEKAEIIDYGDSAVLVEFSKVFTQEAWEDAHWLAKLFSQKQIKGVTEIYPTYTTVLIVFNCLLTNHHTIKIAVDEIIKSPDYLEKNNQVIGQRYRLPVIFGGEWGTDLPFVAAHLGISEDEVVSKFCAGFRKIFTFATFCGFLMEGAPFTKKIPRCKSPHTQVPGGYVAVAGDQTAFVPMTSPSGWQTIGHCPLKAIDLESTSPVPYKPGDYVEFFPIKEEEQGLYEGKTIHEMRVML